MGAARPFRGVSRVEMLQKRSVFRDQKRVHFRHFFGVFFGTLFSVFIFYFFVNKQFLFSIFFVNKKVFEIIDHSVLGMMTDISRSEDLGEFSLREPGNFSPIVFSHR